MSPSTRIVSYVNQLQQEGLEGVLYVEVDNSKSLDEIKAILKGVRKHAFPDSLSFKEEISRSGENQKLDTE